MKKIILLGGSKQQIIAIIKAKDLGIYTILVDFLEDNPGQHYADRFYLESTTNREKVLEIAKREKIDGIIAYASDPAAPTAAYVAEKLNLSTNSYKAVEILTNKGKFRSFLEKHNFKTPQSFTSIDIQDAIIKIKNLKLPIIVKPVDASGSKGVSLLEDLNDIQVLFNNAIQYSLSKEVIFEEYVSMKDYQVAGDGFVIDGKLVFRCYGNDHFNKEGINPFVPISASFPYIGPIELQEKIDREIQRLLNLLEIKIGAFNFDIRVDEEENIYLMEIGPRNGGNYIPQVIKYATGIDMVELSIKSALNIPVKINEHKFNGFWSYYAIHSLKAGILKEIKIDDEVYKNNVIETFINYNTGDLVPAFTKSNSTLGILVMKFESLDEMLKKMETSNWIGILLEDDYILRESIVKVESEDEVESLLKRINPIMTPNLDQIIDDFHEYAKKITNNGEVYKYMFDNHFIGFLAFYANDFNSKTGYISQFAITSDYQGKGYSDKLINFCFKRNLDLGMKCIRLEVDSSNTKAINFYKKNKFTFESFASDKTIYMSIIISEVQK